jgi:hypothetical protein
MLIEHDVIYSYAMIYIKTPPADGEKVGNRCG